MLIVSIAVCIITNRVLIYINKKFKLSSYMPNDYFKLAIAMSIFSIASILFGNSRRTIEFVIYSFFLTVSITIASLK